MEGIMYKVGDIVRVTSLHGNYTSLNPGDIFKINHITNLFPNVQILYPKDDWGISSKSVELTEDYILKELWKEN